MGWLNGRLERESGGRGGGGRMPDHGGRGQDGEMVEGEPLPEYTEEEIEEAEG